jgi:hydrogenase nickel incorporation protein HypA/HybF
LGEYRAVHEYSIVGSLMERVEAEAAARGAVAVHRLRVRIGELSGVETSLLKAAYETFREGSICAAAELEIVPVAARWSCPACAVDLAPGGPLRCPTCGGPAGLAEGDEIVLDRMELEVPDV